MSYLILYSSAIFITETDLQPEVALAVVLSLHNQTDKFSVVSFKLLHHLSRLMIKPTKWHTFAPSEDSDQPGHLPSLIRVFAVRIKKAGVLSYPLSAQRRLWSDWADAQADSKTLIRLGGCPGWSESSLGAHVILLVLSWGGSFCV